jgi:serine/threonine-protein kinase
MLSYAIVQASFGRYELVSLLDKGGMGEVWLARTRGPERVHKTVVLKRIRAERARDEAARARFTDEARIAMSLSHPHIVPVFELGELDGAYFLVMEWLRGGDLSRVAGIGRTPLLASATALIGSQLSDALAYVHARENRAGARLVHGDVAPRNVLFSGDGHALLADFGLARFAGQGRAGTLRYLAPEQARGEPFDARADLYALALVLAEAATGRPAYDRDAERALKQARVGIIPDFAGCDEALAQVLRRALAALPDGRFADAAAMRAAFDAFLDREPGARAAGRDEIIARLRASGASPVAEPSRSATLATRDATGVRVRTRVGDLLLALLFVAVAAAFWLRYEPNRPHATLTQPTPLKLPAPIPPTPRVPSPERSSSPPTHEPTRAHPTRHADRATSAPAILDVNATPWAHVRVDGKLQGETPLIGLSLPAGIHTIELANEPLGVHREIRITLQPGEHVTRVEELSP